MTVNGQTAVGAFVLGGAALIVGAGVFFGKFNPFHPSTRAAIVFQDSVSGLSVGSQVTFRGVQVGAVDSIAILFDTGTHNASIQVTIHLEPAGVSIAEKGAGGSITLPTLPDLIGDGLSAELATQSFVTGQAEIDLDFAPGPPVTVHQTVASLPEIPTRQSTVQKVKLQLSQLPLHEMADNTNAALRSIRALADRLDHDLPPLAESLKTTADTSTAAVEVATSAIKDIQGRLDAVLGDIAHLATTGDRQMKQRGADLHTLLESSNQTMVQARAVLNDVDGLTSSRAPARTNVEASLRDLAAAAASLRGFANDVEHNPQLLLTGRRQ